MENKKELYSIHQCESVEDFKELQRQRYKRWYQAIKRRKANIQRITIESI